MSELLSTHIEASLPSLTADGRAREAALRAGASFDPAATSLVSYRSAGYLLIVGEEEAALSAAHRIGPVLHRTVVVTGPALPETALSEAARSARREASVAVFRGAIEQLEGHLGRFSATLAAPQGEPLQLAELNGSQHPYFDLVLDLQAPPLLNHELPPFGYYPVGADPQRLERALAELPEMTGEFEKPKFFNYNPDICAHGDSGLTGCTRCLDVCPTSAIRSLGDRIEVDPYLCQGGGSCATACPTGAIIYAYPQPKDQLAAIRGLLKSYREAGGERPLLLFHDAEQGAERLSQLAAELPERVLPVQVAELGAIGMDVWLSSLAYGADAVALLDTPEVTAAVRGELEAQLEYAGVLLTAMGYPPQRLQLLSAEALPQRLAAGVEMPAIPPASFDTFNEKRSTLRLALDHLYAHAAERPVQTPLPAGAPFGQIEVAQEACTLCMACSQVCPARALEDGGDKPQLNFIEDLCVQCGLCQRACPEQAISLQPRYLFAWEERRRRRVLNEEQPFCCIGCGTAFTTGSVVRRLTERLREHAMFRSEADLRRLQMCGDCRVVDMLGADLKDAPRPKVYG